MRREKKVCGKEGLEIACAYVASAGVSIALRVYTAVAVVAAVAAAAAVAALPMSTRRASGCPEGCWA